MKRAIKFIPCHETDCHRVGSNHTRRRNSGGGGIPRYTALVYVNLTAINQNPPKTTSRVAQPISQALSIVRRTLLHFENLQRQFRVRLSLARIGDV